MLWDLIRDYFVQYIFGGTTSSGDYFTPYYGLNHLFTDGSDYHTEQFTSGICFPIGNVFDEDIGEVGAGYISMGDWLSTSSTIITLVIILVLCGLFIKKMVSSVSHLMGR